MMQDVEITCPGGTAFGTTIKINGEEVPRVKRLQVNIAVDEEPPLVIIEKYACPAIIKGKFEIDEIIVFPDLPGKKYRLVEVEE